MDRSSTRRLAGLLVAALLATGLRAGAQSNITLVPAQMQSDMSFGNALDNEGKIRQIIVYRDKQQIQALDVCTGHDIPRDTKLGELAREDFNF